MKRFYILLKRFIPPYKKYVWLNVLFNLLSTIFSLFSFALIIPILEILFNTKSEVYTLQSISSVSMSQVFDVLKNNLYFYTTELINTSGALSVLIILAVFLILMTFLKVATAYFGSFFMVNIRTGVLRDLRNLIFSKIVYLPIGFFNDERKGDIMSRMTLDVNEVEASIMSSLDMLFKNPLMIATYIIVMFSISWELTLFVLVLLPVSGYFIGQIGKSLKRKSLEGSILTGDLTSQIEETLGGLRIIKAFNAENKIISRFLNLNNRLRHTLTRIQARYLLAHPMSEFMGTVVIATVLCYGGNLILNGNSGALTASVFIYYILIFYSIINPVKELSKAAYSVQKGMASLERIDKILETQNPLQNDTKEEITSFEHAIEFKNVSFKYKDAWVLRNIN
ncbi:MAG: ABC transporter ATP-binding protein, partial [Paludibacteraceae bacterium]|nr:ABC transporter ATP-binding protein [Paludibacteraceae bacterium]